LKGNFSRSLANKRIIAHALCQILGEPAPEGKQLEQLPSDKEQLYRMLVNDHIAPLCV
jgi:hypothetical protein